MDEIVGYMKDQFDPTHYIVRERFKFWSNVRRKPGETIQELAARIRQDAVTCDFPAIKDPLDEAMRTRFICSVDNEAILKALFKIKDKELTFAKAIAVAVETEEAVKRKRCTGRPALALSIGFKLLRNNLEKISSTPGLEIGKKVIFPREHALGAVRATTSPKTALFEKLFAIFVKRWDTCRQSV